MKPAVYQWLARHRDQEPVRTLHRIAGAIERACENDSFRSSSNGEDHALRRCAEFGLHCVFDVGAHIGEWSTVALAAGASTVHAFEIEPSSRSVLLDRFASEPRVTVPPVGLASESGLVKVAIEASNSSVSSTVLSPLHPDRTIVECPVTTGDEYMEKHGIERIDYLKIDVEGADIEVFRGFLTALESRRIRTIQFEFTLWAAIARVWLGDFYDLLSPHGYTIGKIYPRRIDWRRYGPEQERFMRANFLATIDAGVVRALR